ncbi:MAG: SDR family NAD(P)-dependent oxidoreductase [Actinomycetota bacterium]
MTSSAPAESVLTDASVLLTGASGGIGTALVDELHRRGARLTMVARHEESLERLSAPGTKVALDLRSPDAGRRSVEAAVTANGGVDVVINAFGVVAFGPVSELSIDVLEELFLTNTFAPIVVSQAALAVMEPGGVIVNISGVIAEQNLPGMAAYGASKAALRSFDEALAREARRRKIRIVDARPPHTETGLATRPIDGEAPKMPTGLDPAAVAKRICDAIDGGLTDLPAEAF